MKKIFIASSTFAEIDKRPLEELKKAGFEIIANPYKRRLTEKEIIDLGKDCAGVIAGLGKYTLNVMKNLSKLKVISRVGTGLDNVDLEAAEKLKISVFNTPQAPVEPVSEFTVGLLLSLVRNIPYMDNALKRGQWKRASGTLLKDKVIGIIGLGRIGKRTAALLKAFECRQILAYDICYDKNWIKKNNYIKCVEFKKLLNESDIILIHAAGNTCMIGENEINSMKKGVFIVNTSRGSMIDENALCKALKAKAVAGVAIDTFDKEPYNGELTAIESAVLTPHVASNTFTTRTQMEMEASKNVIKALKGRG